MEAMVKDPLKLRHGEDPATVEDQASGAPVDMAADLASEATDLASEDTDQALEVTDQALVDMGVPEEAGEAPAVAEGSSILRPTPQVKQNKNYINFLMSTWNYRVMQS